MANADPITVNGTLNPDTIDPMLAALRQAIIDATGSAIDEFTAENVAIVAPDATQQSIDATISAATGKAKGLCLLLVGGSAKNPDKSAPGPRLTLELEAQLYVSQRIRGRSARPVLELVAAVMRTVHHAQLRISGFPWYEELAATGFDPLPDEDYTAFSIHIERDFQL